MLLLLDSWLNAQQIITGSSQDGLALVQQHEPSWEAIEHVAGRTITVVRTDNHSQTGQLRQASDDSLTMSDHDRSVVISREDVRRVYARTSRSRKKGALWGLAFGAGGGAIVGAALVKPCNTNSFCLNVISRGQGAAIVATAGAAVGAGVGALVGGGRNKVLLYDREAPASRN
jgi:hypothetical protein